SREDGLGHVVVVGGKSPQGNVNILDPWMATEYDMTLPDFQKAWDGHAVYKAQVTPVEHALWLNELLEPFATGDTVRGPGLSIDSPDAYSKLEAFYRYLS